jgi:hypothetical protein
MKQCKNNAQSNTRVIHKAIQRKKNKAMQE